MRGLIREMIGLVLLAVLFGASVVPATTSQPLSAAVAESGVDLTPDSLVLAECNGQGAVRTFSLSNTTGAAFTFDLSYTVTSGNGSVSGPDTLYVNHGETVDFSLTVTPDLCLPSGVLLQAEITATGNGGSDLATVDLSISNQGSWQDRTAMTTARAFHSVACGGDGGLYAVGGVNAAWEQQLANQRYDIVGQTWSSRAPLPAGISMGDAAVLDGVLYLPGGWDNGAWVTTSYAYDIGGDSWSTIAPAPRPAMDYAAAACNGLLYRSGGGEEPAWTYGSTGLEAFDPATGTWTSLTGMSCGRSRHAMGCIDGKLYVAGGYDQLGRLLSSAAVYEPATDSWRDIAELPVRWLGGGDLVINGRLLLVGGMVDGDPSSFVLAYDPTSDAWLPAPSLPAARYDLSAAACVDGGYAIGGQGWAGAGAANQHLADCPACSERGYLAGTVSDLETAGASPPCTGAVVHIEPGEIALTVDPVTGSYGPLELISYPYQVEAEAPGHTGSGAEQVVITTGSTSVRDFSLQRPMAELSSTSLSVTAEIDTLSTHQLVISNQGHQPLEIAVAARPSAPAAITRQQSGELIVEAELRAKLADGSSGCLIFFRERPDLSSAADMAWIERGRFVVNALQETARHSQERVRAYLRERGLPFTAFWIDNLIVLESMSASHLAQLQSFHEIAALRARRRPQLGKPLRSENDTATKAVVEPNLIAVGADQVWAMGIDGEGIVVGSIDTGVSSAHQALVEQYRGNNGDGSFTHDHSWWDPYDHDLVPNDSYAHGSHTMGTILGSDGGANQIGMAPAASWIACQGFNPASTDIGLLECAQFMAAPWDLTGANPDPDRRPHIVNNSWGDCGTSFDGWFLGAIASWHAAGIYPVFSNGNAELCGYTEPAGCNTVINPGRYGTVTSVGSSGLTNGEHAAHSNWGPSDDPDLINPRGYPDLKPQVVAPGVSVRSAFGFSEDIYTTMSGTSMAAPHVSGLVALMWQAAPCLIGRYAATETIIEETATPIPYATGCAGEGPGAVPNYATGWGQIDAAAAVQAAMAVCDLPWLEVSPVKGQVAPAESLALQVSLGCWESGRVTAHLHIATNDPCATTVSVPVSLWCIDPLFADGFESGDTTAWSATGP